MKHDLPYKGKEHKSVLAFQIVYIYIYTRYGNTRRRKHAGLPWKQTLLIANCSALWIGGLFLAHANLPVFKQ